MFSVSSPLQRLLHQLLGAGLRVGQHALVVGALADVAAEDLEDSGHRRLAGELGGVVGRPLLLLLLAAAPPVLQAGALLEDGGEPVVVAADLALGRLPDAHALGRADRAVRGVGPVGVKRTIRTPSEPGAVLHNSGCAVESKLGLTPPGFFFFFFN